MTSRTRRSFVLAGGLAAGELFLLSGAARADRIYLDDNVVEGRIVREDPLNVVVDIGQGRVTVDRARILRIEKAPWTPPAPKPAPVPAPPATPPAAPEPPPSPAPPAKPAKGGKGAATPEQQAAALVQRLKQTEDRGERRDLRKQVTALGAAAVPALIAGLGDASARSEGRFAIAGLLGGLKDARALDALVAAAGGSDDVVAQEALVSLAALGAEAKSKRAEVQKLLAESASLTVRTLAATALKAMGDPAALPALVPALADPTIHVRDSVQAAILSLAPRPADATLMGQLDGLTGPPYPLDVRRRAMECIAALADPQRASWLIDVVQDDERSPAIRRLALAALARIGTAEAVEAVLRSMKHPNIEVRAAACAAAANLPAEVHEAVIPELIEALRNPEPAGPDAYAALKTMTGQSFPRSFTTWLEWWRNRPKASTESGS